MNLRLLPTTTTLATYGLSWMRLSMGWGATFFPPEVTMMSFFRSVMIRKPSSSKRPMSPVWNQPPAMTSRVAASFL